MPFTIVITLANDTATFDVGSTIETLYTLYNLTSPMDTRIQYGNVFSGLYDNDYAVRATQNLLNGTSETDYQEFTVAGSTTLRTTPFLVAAEPSALQAVYNPMLVSMTKSNYEIGDLFFVEIWTQPGKNVLTTTPEAFATRLRTLRLNGLGDGTCVADVSSALATAFRHDTATTPNPLLPFQKDESAYLGYFLKAGYIRYDEQNREIRTYAYQSGVKFTLRAALPLNGSGDMQSDYAYQYDGEPVRYLSTVPDRATRKPSEPTLLPFFLPLQPAATGVGAVVVHRLFAQADLTFTDGTTQNGYLFGDFVLPSGGMYLVDAKPQRLLAHPRYADLATYSVYLSYFDDLQASVITQARTFKVGEDIQQPVEVLFMNRLGGWDAIQFRRDRQTDIKTKANTFSNGFGSRVYQVDTSTSITYNSGWLTSAEHQWLKDLMVSPAIYLDGAYHRQADTTYKIDTNLGLFTIELTVAPDYEENTIQL